jgi:hypothetical protein
MPTLTKEEALKLANSKFENVLFVGTYDQVRNYAQKRADDIGCAWYSAVRIDEADALEKYNEKYKRWDIIEDPVVNERGFFWFALLPSKDPYEV